MFIDLQQGETILATLRKHYILFLAEIGVLFFLFFIPFTLSLTPFSLPFLAPGTTVFFGALWMLALLVRAFIVWTKFYLDVWIVTNIRLVDIEQISLFNRKSSTLELEHIEDITVKVEGLTQSMVGYGTLSVQTAGHIQEFMIKDIADPESAKQIIYNAQHKTKVARRERIEAPAYHEEVREEIIEKQINEPSVNVASEDPIEIKVPTPKSVGTFRDQDIPGEKYQIQD
jgi:hypothetical protein